MWGNAVPIELRILFYQISGRRIPKLSIHSDFVKLIIQCIGFSQIMRIAELPNEIGARKSEPSSFS